jgi:hypothetical protein
VKIPDILLPCPHFKSRSLDTLLNMVSYISCSIRDLCKTESGNLHHSAHLPFRGIDSACDFTESLRQGLGFALEKRVPCIGALELCFHQRQIHPRWKHSFTIALAGHAGQGDKRSLVYQRQRWLISMSTASFWHSSDLDATSQLWRSPFPLEKRDPPVYHNAANFILYGCFTLIFSAKQLSKLIKPIDFSLSSPIRCTSNVERSQI